ncbi:MAG: ankyrin repeat domain-containing protein [Pseudomonadota bacterium]
MTLNITHLRAQAKALKRALANGDADALERCGAVLGDKSPVRYADILHVIAREAGHPSWPKLKLALETDAMTAAERAERLGQALYNGWTWQVERLLGRDPTLPTQNLGLRVATYDRKGVEDALATPGSATRNVGKHPPFIHLAFSHYIHMAPEREADMLAIADMLLAKGVDINAGVPPEPGSDHVLSPLYGAIGHAGNLRLAQWMLENGADPNDNESLYHATELGHSGGLRLLLEHGANVADTNALARAMDFDNLDMVTLLLEQGADPDEAVAPHPSGQPLMGTPGLHHAARRWCSAPIAEALLAHGADPMRVWNGMTPYAIARIFGSVEVASVLRSHGHETPLSETEALLADCATGRMPRRRLDPKMLNQETALLATRVAACPERLDHLRALVLAGLDPDNPEEMGVSPLQVAGWEGLPKQVEYLLTLAPDLNHVNDFGGDTLATVIHGASFSPERHTRDHLACAQLLLNAGAVLRRSHIRGAGTEDMTNLLETWAEDHPDAAIT